MEALKGGQKKIDKNHNNKIDADDFKILRGEKKVNEEEQVEEGWDDMLKAAKERSGPQPSGGSGIKQGSRYGGSKQKDKPEQDTDEAGKKVKQEEIDPNKVTTDTLAGRVKGKTSNPFAPKKVMMDVPDNVNEEDLDEAKFDPMKHIDKKNQTPAIKAAAKDVKRGSYADRAALMKAGGVKDDRGPRGVTQEEVVAEEAEQLDEAGTGLLMSFIKSKGLNPLTMDGNQKKAYARSSEFRIFKMRHVKETSGMGERGDDWNEEKKQVKEEADAKDVVSMDIPLLIRVLEFIREDVKTDMDLHRVVENLIDLRTEGVLSMDHYDNVVKINMKEEVSESLAGYNKHKIRVKVSKDGGEKHHVDMKVFANSESEAKGVARNKLKQKGYDTHGATHQGIDYSWIKKEEVEQVDERTLSKGETAEKERIVKGMKKSLAGFKARYGDKAKSVMYATATKAAKKD